jgi:hypothetical protein
MCLLIALHIQHDLKNEISYAQNVPPFDHREKEALRARLRWSMLGNCKSSRPTLSRASASSSSISRSRRCSASATARRELMISLLVVIVVAAQIKLWWHRH